MDWWGASCAACLSDGHMLDVATPQWWQPCWGLLLLLLSKSHTEDHEAVLHKSPQDPEAKTLVSLSLTHSLMSKVLLILGVPLSENKGLPPGHQDEDFICFGPTGSQKGELNLWTAGPQGTVPCSPPSEWRVSGSQW